MSGDTPRGPTGTGPVPDWADDATGEAEGFGFCVGDMRDATEDDPAERYAMDDGEADDPIGDE